MVINLGPILKADQCGRSWIFMAGKRLKLIVSLKLSIFFYNSHEVILG